MDIAEEPEHILSGLEQLATNPRKRAANNSDDAEIGSDAKRAKARERQRRKRERDKAGQGVMSFQDHQPQEEDPPPPPPRTATTPEDPSLTPEEQAKKDRVRLAARERQRKHRAVVKAKRMAEMGMPIQVDGSVAVPYHEAYALHAAHLHDGGDPNNPLTHGDGSLPMPHPNQTPGQTFASMMLLALSCAPMIKPHLLRLLNISNEELASFEPIMAATWDAWMQDPRYRQHSEQHPHSAGTSSPYAHPQTHSPYPAEAAQLHAEQGEDFRSRFGGQRYAVAPGQPGHHHPIDPTLNNGAEMLSVSDVRGTEDGEEEAAQDIDPELGEGAT